MNFGMRVLIGFLIVLMSENSVFCVLSFDIANNYGKPMTFTIYKNTNNVRWANIPANLGPQLRTLSIPVGKRGYISNIINLGEKYVFKVSVPGNYDIYTYQLGFPISNLADTINFDIDREYPTGSCLIKKVTRGRTGDLDPKKGDLHFLTPKAINLPIEGTPTGMQTSPAASSEAR